MGFLNCISGFKYGVILSIHVSFWWVYIFWVFGIVFISVLSLWVRVHLLCLSFLLHFCCCKRTNAPTTRNANVSFFLNDFSVELFAQSWSSVSACLPRNHLNAVFLDCLGRHETLDTSQHPFQIIDFKKSPPFWRDISVPRYWFSDKTTFLWGSK